MELTPEGAEESRLQAQVYYYLGDYQKAQAGLSAAAEDGDEDSLRMLGSLYLETGETAGARTLYENALEEGSHPRQPTMDWLCAIFWRKTMRAPFEISGRESAAGTKA